MTKFLHKSVSHYIIFCLPGLFLIAFLQDVVYIGRNKLCSKFEDIVEGKFTLYSLEQLIRLQVQRRLLTQIQDIYKLLYQGILGAEHLIRDENQAVENLLQEYKDLKPGNTDPLVEPVSTDGEMIRVNLRPFKRKNLDIQALADVFLESVTNKQDSLQNFRDNWQLVMNEIRFNLQLNQPEKEIQSFDEMVRGKKFPPVHHSELYRQQYQPCYRVVQYSLFIKKINQL